ncbi:MAG: chaperone NapD [Epsilonproteobacteria bacterium]|nr:chaperone NapD [Campylobacterota bacterium]
MNISSIIVKTRPEYMDEVKESLKQSGVCDIHFSDAQKGIIIVTVEGKNVEEEIAKVRILESLDHVISADMHMSYCQEELEEMMKDIDLQNSLQEVNADKPIEEINYFGSLKGKY